MPPAIIDSPLTWLCTQCKKRSFNHVEFCACGQARPEPEPEKQPEDLPALVENAYPTTYHTSLPMPDYDPA